MGIKKVSVTRCLLKIQFRAVACFLIFQHLFPKPDALFSSLLLFSALSIPFFRSLELFILVGQIAESDRKKLDELCWISIFTRPTTIGHGFVFVFFRRGNERETGMRDTWNEWTNAWMEYSEQSGLGFRRQTFHQLQVSLDQSFSQIVEYLLEIATRLSGNVVVGQDRTPDDQNCPYARRF